MKVIIVGGVAGGATAAARIRRLDEKAQIIIYERSGFISYANCGLPYYIGGEITEKENLTLQTPESFWKRFRIKVFIKHEVTSIDTMKKNVTVRSLETGDIKNDVYDKLVLAPGAKPLIPNMTGTDNPKIFTLRTVEDALKIKEFIGENNPKSAVLAGGGYIGLEMAENLNRLGIKVTIVQMSNQVMDPIDYDMACLVQSELRKNGVLLRLSTTVKGFEDNGGGIKTLVENGEPLESDMVILAIGVVPDNALAKSAGLALGVKGCIVVNGKMETSAKDVYAVGDAVEVTNFVTKTKAAISLAGPANKQGRIAADNICGLPNEFKDSQGSSVIKIFDLTVAATGINEITAAKAGIDYDEVVLKSSSHAAYYPGAKGMTVKVIFEKKTAKILGAQIIGYGGADKRIDVLATAIRAEMTAYDLEDLDLSYAPPYSSAKDPVNMAGYVIENVVRGKVKQFRWNQVETLTKNKNITLLDTRTVTEYRLGHIEGFKNIPLDSLRDRLDEIDKNKPVYVNCQSGLRSYIACRILTQNGFDCYNLSGGFGFYENVVMNKCAETEGAFPCGMVKIVKE